MPAPRLADPFYSVVDPSPFYRRRGKGYVVRILALGWGAPGTATSVAGAASAAVAAGTRGGCKGGKCCRRHSTRAPQHEGLQLG